MPAAAPKLQSSYLLRVYNTSGVLQAIMDDWRTLELQRRVNTFDVMTLGINSDNPKRSLFTLDAILELWRKLPDTPPVSYSVLGPVGYALTVLADSAKAYYRLAETSGVVANDLSGNANTGQYIAAVTLNQAGALGPELDGTSNTAAIGDGASGYVNVPNSSTINFGSGDFSVELWVKLTAAAGARGLIRKGSGSFNSSGFGWELRDRGSGGVEFTRNDGIVGTGPARLTFAGLSTSNYVHIVVTYNSSTGAMIGYANGVQVTTATSDHRAAFTDSYALEIGHGENGYSVGPWDEVALYSSILTPARITAHYNAGVNQYNSDKKVQTTYTPGRSYDWYRESTLLHRTPSGQLTSADHKIFTSYSRGLIDLIARREIWYYANTAQTLKGGPAETVMKQYVEENAGPSALFLNGRASDGVISGFTVVPTAGLGLDWAGQRSFQNLLSVLQEIASASGVDFDVVRTDTGGPVAFEFRTYYPQLGTNRSATVQFGTLLGNMVTPFYTNSRTEEITRVLALGAGENTARRVLAADGTHIADSPWNLIEKSEDARSEDTLTGLQKIAAAVLAKGVPQESFTFQVLQTQSLMYGRDYFLGDIVTASFEDWITSQRKLTAVTLNIAEGKENVSCEFSAVPTFS